MYHKTFTHTFRLITLLAVLVGLLAVPGVTLASHVSPYNAGSCAGGFLEHCQHGTEGGDNGADENTPDDPWLLRDDDGDGTINGEDDCPEGNGKVRDPVTGKCVAEGETELTTPASFTRVYMQNVTGDAHLYSVLSGSGNKIGDVDVCIMLALRELGGKMFLPDGSLLEADATTGQFTHFPIDNAGSPIRTSGTTFSYPKELPEGTQLFSRFGFVIFGPDDNNDKSIQLNSQSGTVFVRHEDGSTDSIAINGDKNPFRPP